MYKTPEKRVALIQDLMIGLLSNLPGREVFFYPFIDAVLLLFQRFVVVTIWEKQKTNNQPPKLVFPCDNDPSQKDMRQGLTVPIAEMVQIDNSNYYMMIHQVMIHPAVDSLQYVYDPKYQKLLGMLLAIPKTDATRKRLFGSVLQYFILAIDRYDERNEQQQTVLPGQKLDPEDAKKMLKPMRTVLDRVFNDIADSPVLCPAPGQSGLFNLFAVSRMVLGSARRFQNTFGFTAHLLLSRSQRGILRRAFPEWDQKSNDLFETPLGLHSRSVADVVFESGVVAFGGVVGSADFDVAGDDTDKRRQELERKVYTRLLRVGVRRRLYSFHIPIHVGGIPWIALFTLYTLTAREAHTQASQPWQHNYHLYRDFLPRAATQIRSEARQIYVQLLAQRLTEQLQLWGARVLAPEAFIQAVCEQWGLLAQVYPFERFELSTVAAPRPPDGAQNTMELPGGQHLVVKMGRPPNTFFRRVVAYDLLDAQSVVDACKSAVVEYSHTAQRISIRSIGSTAHALRTPLGQIKNVVRVLDKSDRKEVLLRDIDKMLHLERFLNSKTPPQFESVTCQEFCSALYAIIEDDLRINQDRAYASNRADLLTNLLQTRKLICKVNSVAGVPPGKSVQYFPPQLRTVVDGLIDNALKHHKRQAPALTLRVHAGEGNPPKEIFLEVRNAAYGTPAEVQKKADDMTQRPSPDWIGVELVHQACATCGFAPPVWSTESTAATHPGTVISEELVAKVQVAKILPDDPRTGNTPATAAAVQ